MLFTCPECGSHFFYFTTAVINNDRIGYCMGKWLPGLDDYSGCDFSWNRNNPEEEGKVMSIKPKVQLFSNANLKKKV